MNKRIGLSGNFTKHQSHNVLLCAALTSLIHTRIIWDSSMSREILFQAKSILSLRARPGSVIQASHMISLLYKNTVAGFTDIDTDTVT
jgi:hypothetical protein